MFVEKAGSPSVWSAKRGNHHLGCRLLLRLLPGGGEDLSGGAGRDAGLRLRGSYQWHRWGSGIVSGMVNSQIRKGYEIIIIISR